MQQKITSKNDSHNSTVFQNSQNSDGIILLAKQPGLTSFSSLNSVKKALNTKKVGHTGTLDSFAQGLLIVCTGRLTRLAGRITEFNKTYQAVIKFGEETDRVKFMKTDAVTALCIYHKGSYDNLRDSYNIILKYIEDNGYEIIDNVRECYIDGCWNKDNVDDYLTEIQFPVRKK